MRVCDHVLSVFGQRRRAIEAEKSAADSRFAKLKSDIEQ